MEMFFAGLVIAVVLVIAAACGRRLVRMSQTLGAVSLVSTTRYDAIVHYAVHGAWPRPGQADLIVTTSAGAHVDRVSLGPHGVITAGLRLHARGASDADVIRGELAFQPQWLGSSAAPAVVYVCGYADPVGSAPASLPGNTTTLDPQYLPPFCR